MPDAQDSQPGSPQGAQPDSVIEAALEASLSLLDALPWNIALLDRSGVIRFVNRGWKSYADWGGLGDGRYGLGLNYLQICEQAALHGNDDAARMRDGLRRVIGGQAALFYDEYPCHAPHERAWYGVRVSPLEGILSPYVFVAHESVTTRVLIEERARGLEQANRALAARLLSVQEQEREHLARELHDGIGQSLTALKWQADALSRVPDTGSLQRLSEGLAATLREVRTLAYDLHGPVKAGAGLNGGIETLVRPLRETGGLRLTIELADDTGLDREQTAQLYRITQEAVANALRHSQGSGISIRTSRGATGKAGRRSSKARSSPELFILTVTDDGVGITEAALAASRSVGLTSMRERARLIGADLALDSLAPPDHGTRITVTLQLHGATTQALALPKTQPSLATAPAHRDGGPTRA